MPVSSDIYSMVGRGVQPVDDPQNALLKALKLQGAQQELQTGSMKMDEYRRGVERGNRLQSLLTGKFATPDERAAAMEGGGFLDEADKYRKSIADRGKVEADTAKTRNEVIGAGLKRYREQLDYIESPQTAARWIQSQYQDPTIGPVMAQFGPVEEALSRIPQDPQAFAQWREQQAGGMEKYRASIEQKPTAVDAGGTKKFLDMNPKSPTYKQEISSTTVTETEAQRLKREQDIKDAAAGRAVQYAGQKIQRDRLELDKGTAVAEAGGPNQAALTKQFGKAPKDHRWRPDGSAEPIPGGPADLKAGEAGAKAGAKRDAQISQAESVLGTIRDAKGLTGYTTAGVGGLAAKIPMTDARNLQAKLETVKANLGFDRLQQMRDNSPTGGALGAVAVQELVALQSTVASLDQLQSPSQLGKALEKIENHYTRWLDVMKQSGGGQGGATGGWGDKPAASKGGPVDFGSLK